MRPCYAVLGGDGMMEGRPGDSTGVQSLWSPKIIYWHLQENLQDGEEGKGKTVQKKR